MDIFVIQVISLNVSKEENKLIWKINIGFLILIQKFNYFSENYAKKTILMRKSLFLWDFGLVIYILFYFKVFSQMSCKKYLKHLLICPNLLFRIHNLWKLLLNENINAFKLNFCSWKKNNILIISINISDLKNWM